MADSSKVGGPRALPRARRVQQKRIKTVGKQVFARGRGRRRGCGLSFGVARSTEPSSQQCSSGVAVGVRASLGSAPVVTTTSPDCANRAVAGIVNVGFPEGIVFVSAYFVAGAELSGPNAALPQSSDDPLSRPWVIQGDFDAPPDFQ